MDIDGGGLANEEADVDLTPGAADEYVAAAGGDYLATRSGAFAGVRSLLLRHILVAVISAVGTTYLVRRLGPTAWGGFAIAYLLLFTIDAMLSRGIIAGLLRRVEPADRHSVASAARLVLYAGLAFAAVLAIF